MSNRRSILLIFLAIAALLAIEVMLERRAVRTLSIHPSLVETDAPIVGIAIERRGEVPMRLEFNDGWKLVEPFRSAASEPTVLRLLDALLEKSVPDRISDSGLAKVGRERSDFSLVEPNLKVTLQPADGEAIAVSFGVPTPSADGVYAAVDGVDSVFIAPMEIFEAVDVSTDALRRRALFGMTPESVRELGIRPGAQPTVTFVREGDDWLCGSRKASVTTLKEYLEALVAAQAQTFVWPVGATNETEHASVALLSGYGLDSESAVTVTLKGIDGLERRIVFGKKASEGSVYALAQNGTAIVTVPASLKDESVQNPMKLVDTRIFPVEASAVSAFTVMDGETAYTLTRAEKGAWRLESPVIAPADDAVAEQVLAKIVQLSTSDVDPAGVSVSVSSDRSNPVRVSRAAILPAGGVNAFRSKKVLGFESEAVRRIVRTPSGPADSATAVVYSREQKSWSVEKPEGRGTVEEKNLGTVLSALSNLEAVRVVKLKVSAADLDDFGLDSPFLTIAVDQDREGSVRRNLLIGKETDAGRYATVGSTDAIFVLSDKVLEKITLPIVSGL